MFSTIIGRLGRVLQSVIAARNTYLVTIHHEVDETSTGPIDLPPQRFLELEDHRALEIAGHPAPEAHVRLSTKDGLAHGELTCVLALDGDAAAYQLAETLGEIFSLHVVVEIISRRWRRGATPLHITQKGRP